MPVEDLSTYSEPSGSTEGQASESGRATSIATADPSGSTEGQVSDSERTFSTAAMTPANGGATATETQTPERSALDAGTAREPTPGNDGTSLTVPARFVRLVADSEVNGLPFAAVAEFNVLGPTGEPLPRSGWVARADSEETTYPNASFVAALAIDGSSATFWHTRYFMLASPPGPPHYLDVDMLTPQSVTGFRMLPRQDGKPYGYIASFRFFISSDGMNWGQPVATGTFENSVLEVETRWAN